MIDYKARRQLVIDYLRTVDPASYNHQSYWRRPGPPSSYALDDPADIIRKVSEGSFDPCGTVACAAGWIAIGVGLNKLDIPEEIAGDPDELSEWLGYSGRGNPDSPFYYDAYNSLTDCYDGVTLAMVIDYLEKDPTR